MADQRTGLTAVIREAGPLPAVDQAEELDLFGHDPSEGSPIEGSVRALRAAARPADPGTSRADRLDQVSAVKPTRRGRPEGSQNLMTESIKRFLLQRFRHPLLGMFEVQATSPADLVKLMVPPGDTPTREDYRFAWTVWMSCNREAAEFVTPKEPRALTITPGSAPLMSMHLDVDQLTLNGVTAGALGEQLGMSESTIKTMLADPMGREVLEGEVLEQAISPEKSNA